MFRILHDIKKYLKQTMQNTHNFKDYNSLEIKAIIATKTLIIFFVFVILHLFIIISIFSYAYGKYFKKNPSLIMVNLSLILDAIYWKALYYILAPDIPGSGRYFLWLEKKKDLQINIFIV